MHGSQIKMRWRKLNPHSHLLAQLKWYYRNRTAINLSLSMPKGIEDDDGDLWIAKMEARRGKIEF